MRPLIALALALTALGGAACSGGDDDADPTTTVPTTTTPPTDPTVESTEPDPTTTTTTAPATTSTIPAPTTTIDPTDALIADIEVDLNAGEAALMAAGADPSNPQLRAELERYFSGEVLARVQTLVDGWASEGLLVRPSTQVDSALVVYSVFDRDPPADPTQARVEVCRIDAAVVYELLPDGREAIVDDGVYRSVSEASVILVDDIWRADTGTATSEQTGPASCDR